MSMSSRNSSRRSKTLSLVASELGAIQSDFLNCLICDLPLCETRMCSRCSKMFHSTCIDVWLRDGKTCPSCKKQIIFEDLPTAGWIDELAERFRTLPISSNGYENSFDGAEQLELMESPSEWKSLKPRLSVTRTMNKWIVALLPLPEYTLSIYNDGSIVALSTTKGELWRTSIKKEGSVMSHLWHAAFDERRNRLLFCFHEVTDVIGIRSVNLYCVGVEEVEERAKALSSTPISTNLFYSSRDWRCISFTVNADFLFCTDWIHNKVGIWKISSIDTDPNAKPLTTIEKPSELNNFNPTNCAVLNRDDGKRLQLAVSDWKNHKVLLFNITVDQEAESVDCQFVTVLASKRTIPNVQNPVDLFFDQITGNLIIGDQKNQRIQVLLAAPELPNKLDVLIENIGHDFSAITMSEVECAGTTFRYVVAGLKNGEVRYFRIVE